MIDNDTKIISVSLRLATEDDKHLDTYDNTKLTAVNTCPTWGVLRYQMHKTFAGSGRAMALEAGSAMHEVFAAVRLWQLWHYDLPNLGKVLGRYPLIDFHGIRLFGKDRYEDMLAQLNPEEDERSNCMLFCLQALFNSGFYDDPQDRRRTLSNLEECAIMYIDKWDFRRNPVWIRDINDSESDVGIEIAFDVVITYQLLDLRNEEEYSKEYRFTGKLDGLHTRDGKLVVSENKTASRLDDAWRQSFEMSSQITGYALAGSVFTGEPITKAIVYGVQVPLPKSYDLGGHCVEYVNRSSESFERWFEWFLHSVSYYETYKDNPSSAPRYTHSCNRYFRPCSFITFCVADKEEQEVILEEMVTEEWSPLHEAQGAD